MADISTESRFANLLTKIISPGEEQFSQELAEYLIDLRFPPEDQKRLKELAERQRQGQLTEAEEAEMDSYIHVADLVEALKAKAHASLK